MSRSAVYAIVIALLLYSIPVFSDEGGPPTLAIGAAAPDFCLPGIDGQTHCLKDDAMSKVLVIAFTCNHCLIAQLYEDRIRQLASDYKDRRADGGVVYSIGRDQFARIAAIGHCESRRR